MTPFSNVCGDSPVNNKIIFIDGNVNHFDYGAIRQMVYKKIQPFVIKSGDYINDQTNDNVPNTKLKSIYNVKKSAWMLKYGTTKFSPHHMKSVLVEAWYAFKMSAGNIIRDIFEKKLPTLRPPNLTTNIRACAASIQVSLGTSMNE